MAFDPDPVTGDLQRYEAENHPTDDTSTSGGDLAVSPTAITTASLGYIPTTPIPVLSDPDLEWFYKEILKNTSGTDDLPAPQFFVRNGLIRPTSAGVFSFSCVESTKVRMTFINNSGSVWDTEEITIPANVVTLSTKSVEADSHVYAEVISGSGASAVLANAPANIFIARGSNLGLIPLNFSVADSLHQIAIEDVVDATTSTTNRLTEPVSGIGTFTEAFSVTTSLIIPGGLDLAVGEFIGIWWKIIRPNGMPSPIEKFQPILRVRTFI